MSTHALTYRPAADAHLVDRLVARAGVSLLRWSATRTEHRGERIVRAARAAELAHDRTTREGRWGTDLRRGRP